VETPLAVVLSGSRHRLIVASVCQRGSDLSSALSWHFFEPVLYAAEDLSGDFGSVSGKGMERFRDTHGSPRSLVNLKSYLVVGGWEISHVVGRCH
jgi:hypothetical protein